MTDTQDIFFSTDELKTQINKLGREEAIDFEQINLEKEYFYNNEIDLKGKSVSHFIGDMDESTEIHSLLNPFEYEYEKKNKINTNSFDNSETEEILAILRKKSSTAPSGYSRIFSKSSPQFYEAKRINMTGRIIEYANSEKNCSELDVSKFSLPVHSPVPIRPKCVPKNSITEGDSLRFTLNKDLCKEILMSKCEKELDL